MKKDSVAQYEQMEASLDWFPNHLRVNLEWDDSKYESMIQNINDVLKDYADSDCFPKSVRYFFTSEIDHIIGTVTNELFLNKTIPNGYTQNEFISLIEKRKSELLDLKSEFFYGEI